ncbi:nitroreductase family protein [Microbacterium aerolatum]|uniref:Nitroreductase n=1 Tax=Microbacterium aerolatum TaxID=153731 RepID=A0A511AC61_9MICO|nr:nitroreductase family protein [Microbacterium aerolatum]GEK85764.1 nitroreductase [Microbacterium aerolatum]GGB20519.1 nitroreductase [Microbacterium aerolatum]
MSTPVLERTAETSVPLLDVLAERWSPRAFDPTSPIDEAKLTAALEAARWAPSASNTQPWRFIVARRGTDLHATIDGALVGFNREWAGNAQVLVAAFAEETDADGNPRPWAQYDLGQAVAHLSVQAHADGLFTHQMGGVDREALRALPGVDERFTPVSVIALGELGDASALSEKLQERETAPRLRRPLDETIIASA